MQILTRFLSFITWFGDYDSGKFKIDFVAGLTVALFLIPQSMAYAQLASLPAYYGLYAPFLPPMIAACLWGSRQLATGIPKPYRRKHMSEKVLLVDDEKEFVEALGERLSNRGMDVSTITSAKDVIRKVNLEVYDAIVLDLKMPGTDVFCNYKEKRRYHKWKHQL